MSESGSESDSDTPTPIKVRVGQVLVGSQQYLRHHQFFVVHSFTKGGNLRLVVLPTIQVSHHGGNWGWESELKPDVSNLDKYLESKNADAVAFYSKNDGCWGVTVNGDKYFIFLEHDLEKDKDATYKDSRYW